MKMMNTTTLTLLATLSLPSWAAYTGPGDASNQLK